MHAVFIASSRSVAFKKLSRQPEVSNKSRHILHVPYYPNHTSGGIRRISSLVLSPFAFEVKTHFEGRFTMTQHLEFTMAKLSMSSVLRKILSTDLEMPTDDVLRQAKARGITATDKSIRANIHTIRSVMKKAPTNALIAPAATKKTVEPKSAMVAATGTSDLAGVFSNVALVNKIVALCGSIENVRQTAEAVQTCGGVEAFLQHLELVASIRPTE